MNTVDGGGSSTTFSSLPMASVSLASIPSTAITLRDPSSWVRRPARMISSASGTRSAASLGPEDHQIGVIRFQHKM